MTKKEQVKLLQEIDLLKSNLFENIRNSKIIRMSNKQICIQNQDLIITIINLLEKAGVRITYNSLTNTNNHMLVKCLAHIKMLKGASEDTISYLLDRDLI